MTLLYHHFLETLSDAQLHEEARMQLTLYRSWRDKTPKQAIQHRAHKVLSECNRRGKQEEIWIPALSMVIEQEEKERQHHEKT